MLDRRPAILAATLTALAALAAAGLYGRATARGVGLYGDSVDYVAAARSILAGQGVKTLDGQGGVYPMAQFPPGYPLLLAGASVIGRADPVDAARPLNGLLLFGTVALAGAGAWRATRSGLAATIAAGLTATGVPVLSMAARLYSEAAFLVLSLLALLLLAEALNGRRQWAVAAGLAAGTAVAVRYAGVGLVGVGVVVLLLHHGSRHAETRNTILSRLWSAAIFLAVALLPAVAWATRNVLMAGKPTSRVLRFHPPPWDRLADGAATVLGWLPLDWWRREWIGNLFGLTVFLLLMRYGSRRKPPVSVAPTDSPDAPAPSAVSGTRGVMSAWLLGYPLFLLASLAFFDANVPLNDRILCPLYAPAAVLGASFCVWPAEKLRAGGRAAVAAWFVGTLLGVNLLTAWHWSAATQERGMGYARPRWERSQTIRALSALPPDFCVYTDGYDAVYLLTGRRVRQLPKTGHRSAGEANPRYDAEVNAMADALRKTGGWIVLFDHIDRDDFLMTEADLRQRFELVDARRKQPSDGRIYQVVFKYGPS